MVLAAELHSQNTLNVCPCLTTAGRVKNFGSLPILFWDGRYFTNSFFKVYCIDEMLTRQEGLGMHQGAG